MPSLMIIGTAHVIDLSSSLEGYIRDFEPTAVALELDRERWFALQTNTENTNAPFLLKILSNVQKYLGEHFGSSPGSEMLVAGKVANSLGAEIKLIDKAIMPTIMGAWRNMPSRDRTDGVSRRTKNYPSNVSYLINIFCRIFLDPGSNPAPHGRCRP